MKMFERTENTCCHFEFSKNQGIKNDMEKPQRIKKKYYNGPEDQGSISSQVISTTQNWYFMLPCLKLNIKATDRGLVKQPWKRVTPLHLSLVAIKKGALG